MVADAAEVEVDVSEQTEVRPLRLVDSSSRTRPFTLGTSGSGAKGISGPWIVRRSWMQVFVPATISSSWSWCQVEAMVLIAIHRRAMRSRTFSIWAHLAASSTGSSWSTSGTCRSRASNSALKDSCNITLPWRKAHKWKDTSTKHILSLTNMLKFIEMAEALWGLQELGPLIKFCQTGFLVQYLSSITWNRGHKRHNSRIAHGKVPPGSSLNYPQTACIYRKTRKSKNPKVLCQERQEAFQDPKRKSSPWERFHSMRTIPVHENDSSPWERFQSPWERLSPWERFQQPE